MQHRNLTELPAFEHNSTNLNVVVESPRGSSVKFDYNPDTDVFELSYIMPAGTVFPFEFGFIPSTLGDDGDPVDILVLMDASTCVGCVLVARPIGVIAISHPHCPGLSRIVSRRKPVAETLRELRGCAICIGDDDGLRGLCALNTCSQQMQLRVMALEQRNFLARTEDCVRCIRRS